MRYVDMETWSRGKHFKFFNTFAHPHMAVCANVDLTAFRPAVKQRNLSFNVAIVYVLARAANVIPEFRYRIRQETVIEHEVVHPSFIILANDDLFSFCAVDYTEDFSSFAARAAEQIAYAKANPTLENKPELDNLLYMTSIPWVSFTSIMHPLPTHPADSIPRIAWGKFFNEGKFLKMPLSVQAHHALVDGIHAGKFYEEVQNALYQPEVVLGDA